MQFGVLFQNCHPLPVLPIVGGVAALRGFVAVGEGVYYNRDLARSARLAKQLEEQLAQLKNQRAQRQNTQTQTQTQTQPTTKRSPKPAPPKIETKKDAEKNCKNGNAAGLPECPAKLNGIDDVVWPWFKKKCGRSIDQFDLSYGPCENLGVKYYCPDYKPGYLYHCPVTPPYKDKDCKETSYPIGVMCCFCCKPNGDLGENCTQPHWGSHGKGGYASPDPRCNG